MIQEEILFNIVVTESTCLPYGLPQRTINIELKKKKKKKKKTVYGVKINVVGLKNKSLLVD